MPMHHDLMEGWMGIVGGLVWLLLVAVLVLGIAALLKYLRS